MSATSNKPTYPEQYQDFDYQHDEDSPSEPAFDWKEFQALCIAPEPNHPIYGMSLTEYSKYIRTHGEEDDQKLVTLRFRAPGILSFAIPILARRHRFSMRKYLTNAVIIGMITFQKDYHDRCFCLNLNVDKIFNSADDDAAVRKILQFAMQRPINLRTASRDNTGYTPSVPEWVAAAITTVASELNMTKSDMICLALAIAVINDSKDTELPRAFLGEIRKFISEFEDLFDVLENTIQLSISKIAMDISTSGTERTRL